MTKRGALIAVALARRPDAPHSPDYTLGQFATIPSVLTITITAGSVVRYRWV